MVLDGAAAAAVPPAEDIGAALFELEVDEEEEVLLEEEEEELELEGIVLSGADLAFCANASMVLPVLGAGLV